METAIAGRQDGLLDLFRITLGDRPPGALAGVINRHRGRSEIGRDGGEQGFHINRFGGVRSEEHTFELQSQAYFVCRRLLD